MHFANCGGFEISVIYFWTIEECRYEKKFHQYKLNRIVPSRFFYYRYRGKKDNWIDLIFVVYIERVCKRWSTNDVSFHFATRCVSSQTEITHGNALFSFSHIYYDPRINEVYTRETSRSAVYKNGRTEQPPNELIAEYLFRYSFDFAICRLKSTVVTGKRENEFRLNIATTVEEFTSKKFKYILSVSTRYNPFLAPSTIQQPWHSMKLRIYFHSSPYRYRRTTVRPQNPALWNIAGSICHVNDKLVRTLDLTLIYTFHESLPIWTFPFFLLVD